MHVAYWIVGGLLAAFYLYSGGIKVVRSPESLRPMMGWIDTVPLWLVRVIGLLEVVGAVGLILPPLTGVAPGLAVLAASGLLILQVEAIALHLRRGESRLIVLNLVLLAAAAAALWLATGWL